MKVISFIFITVLLAGFSGMAMLSIDYRIQGFGVIASAVVGELVTMIYGFIDTHGQGIVTWFKANILNFNKDIYISFSYLYRIEIEGKYLLVRGELLDDRYQPVGGVYKYYQEASDFLKGTIHAIPETQFTNNIESDDLRMRIKGKYLLAFYDWFGMMKNREYDPRREFYEELISSGLLSDEAFKNIRYRKVGVHNKGITKSIVLTHIQEVIYADIFEIALNDEQKKLIKEAVKAHPHELCLATPEEIKSRQYGGVSKMNIGNNALWLLEE